LHLVLLPFDHDATIEPIKSLEEQENFDYDVVRDVDDGKDESHQPHAERILPRPVPVFAVEISVEVKLAIVVASRLQPV
jgi:CRISPR/Cas system CMR subunit Cmr6 (Cas7 group RAMP superfamily)